MGGLNLKGYWGYLSAPEALTTVSVSVFHFVLWRASIPVI